jgi:hypothetical protein
MLRLKQLMLDRYLSTCVQGSVVCSSLCLVEPYCMWLLVRGGEGKGRGVVVDTITRAWGFR